MRIWEQGLVATYSIPGYKELILEHYDAFRRPDTDIAVHGVKDVSGPLALQIAGKAVNYAYLQRFHEQQILANARQAEREGFDAIILGALQDPVLREARAAVDIPVLGYGEVSMLTAMTLGERFGFITINPNMEGVINLMIRDRGLEARAAPTTFMECGYPDLSAAVEGQPQRFLDAFHEAADRAMRQNGVDVILPGVTIITELLWKYGVTRVGDAAVLDPRLPLLRMAEMMVEMRRAGVSVSRRGYFWAKPPAELVASVMEFYGLPK